MRKAPFIWLGSKRASKRAVGHKGQLLDEAAAAGLPVPSGAVLLDVLYQFASQEGWVALKNGQVVPLHSQALYDALYETVRFPRLEKPVAVRTAFSQRQSADQGARRSIVNLAVDFSDPGQLAKSLCEVWSAAERRQGKWRRDVLVMEMVKGPVSGVAFTEQAYEDDLVHCQMTATNATLEGGADKHLHLPKLRSWEPATKDVPAFAQRLQKLLRGLRRTFGHQDWTVEWIDDGQICWLIQVQSLIHSQQRDEVFVFMEAMPDPPSPLMTGIVANRAPALFEVFRGFDSSLPGQRPLIEVFAGRPFLNLSLLTEVARHWGFPTRLVTDAVSGHIDRETGFNFLRFWRRPLIWLRQAWAQARAVSWARDTADAILAGTQQPGDSFSQCIDTLSWLFQVQMQETLRLTAALSIPLFLLPQTNRGRLHPPLTFMADMAPLQKLVAANPPIKSALTQGKLPSDPEFQRRWQAYLAQHGHRGPYEADVARARYHERPEPLLRYLAHKRPSPPSPPPSSWQQRLRRPFRWQARRLVQARQRLYHEAMLGTDRIRQRLLQLADAAATEGQLPQPDCLWWLYPDEVKMLDDGRAFTVGFFEQRQAEMARQEAKRLPALIRRFKPLSWDEEKEEGERKRHQFSGAPLTAGEANGRAWVLIEPQTSLPPGFTADQTILITRTIDAGWIPTLSLVAGVVTEIGGQALCSLSILHYLGLPAITNIYNATRQIESGEALKLRATSGTVTRV